MTKDNCNILSLLRTREVSVTRARQTKKGNCALTGDCQLQAWVEVDFLRRCSATYCKFQSSPRSTIATAYSCDGESLASTHGDHTVKIVDSKTGTCKKTLTGHRRTPWVVSFHPKDSSLLASGSLDHEVRLWNLSDSGCVRAHDFGRPIASLAFHPSGSHICVASGHKLHLWDYSKREPVVILKTRRSLRAVHYHPQGQALVLTAELMDPNPAHLLTPSLAPVSDQSLAADQKLLSGDDPQARQWELMFAAATAAAAAVATGTGSALQIRNQSHQILELASRSRQRQFVINQPGTEPMHSVDDTPAFHTATEQLQDLSSSSHRQAGTSDADMVSATSQIAERLAALSSLPEQAVSSGSASETTVSHAQDRDALASTVESRRADTPPLSSTDTTRSMAPSFGADLPAPLLRLGWNLPAQLLPGIGLTPGVRLPPVDQNPTAAAAVAGAVAAWNIIGQEQPCRVKLRVWRYNTERPHRALEEVQLTISDAVLCSEMGVHFSPCGRYLAACVACQAPPVASSISSRNSDQSDDASSTQPPMYEIRVYSLEPATLGHVLSARRIRAAHCLTSLQFSPTSQHLLLAYGRRHISLLRSLMVEGGTIIPVHTILEVYRVSDMALVRVMLSAEDEVNAAAFHPIAGGGIAYGTKEGRLRVIRHDRCPSRQVNRTTSSKWRSLDDELMEADTVTECSSDDEAM